jgi:hypothetical protein
VTAGYVGAPATPGVTAPNFGRMSEKKKTWMILLEKTEEKKKNTLDDCVARVKKKTWDDYENRTDWKLIRVPIGTSWS